MPFFRAHSLIADTGGVGAGTFLLRATCRKTSSRIITPCSLDAIAQSSLEIVKVVITKVDFIRPFVNAERMDYRLHRFFVVEI